MKKLTNLFAVLTCAAFAFSFWSCDNGNKVETYTVTYEDGVDDAEIAVPSDSTKYKTGDTVTVKFEGIGNREGYTFAGWKDATTTYTESGTSTFKMKAADVTLTAQWTQNTATQTPSSDDDATTTTPSDNSTTTPSTPADPSTPTTPTTPADPSTPATPTTPTATLTANTSLQALITGASAGGNVELTGTSGAGTYISIDKALTVDGKNIEGLTVYVLPSVSSKVTLKNFKKATVKVASPATAARSALWARGAEGADAQVEDSDAHFKKMGEDAIPLHFEGCEIEKFEAEVDVALFLENGEKKSEFDEVKLKEGVEDFTFIEMDKENTALTEKTKVGDFIIEDGVEKVNLIGGTFDNVALADDFSGKVDFKYDKEFTDQFASDFDKEAFFKKSEIEAKDIGVVEVGSSSASGSGIYKFSIPIDYYASFDGRYTVIFMTDEQAKALEDSQDMVIPSTVASIEHPIYAAIPTGCFRIDFEGDKTKPLTIFGSEGGYIDYGAAHARGLLSYCEKQDIIVLENYRNYNKEAFIAEYDNTNVTIYVNMAAVRKNDIVLCANTFDGNAYGEAGSKMTEISLEGYKPYISLNWQEYRQYYESAHPQPTSPEVDQAKIEEFRNSEDLSVNWEGFGAKYSEDYALLQAYWAASEAYEPAYEESRNFALATAIKTSDPNRFNKNIEQMIPYGDALKLSWEFNGTFTPMVTSTTYPDVSNVVPTVKKVQGNNVYQEMLDTWQDVPATLPEEAPEPAPMP